MTKTIDPVKLKTSAERLEWVLKQYPDSEDVQNLLRALLPLLADAKAGRIREPVDSKNVPGSYNFADGIYEPYSDPDVGDAYSAFRVEMRGGLTEQDKKALARMQAIRDGVKPHG
jgi:hypothetical protein